jgi:hypothetical protein
MNAEGLSSPTSRTRKALEAGQHHAKRSANIQALFLRAWSRASASVCASSVYCAPVCSCCFCRNSRTCASCALTSSFICAPCTNSICQSLASTARQTTKRRATHHEVCVLLTLLGVHELLEQLGGRLVAQRRRTQHLHRRSVARARPLHVRMPCAQPLAPPPLTPDAILSRHHPSDSIGDGV